MTEVQTPNFPEPPIGSAGGPAGRGLAGMSLSVSSVSAKKRAEREAAEQKAEPQNKPQQAVPAQQSAPFGDLDSKDPFAPLWQLDGVAQAASEAAQAISAVHRHKANLRKHNVTGSESVLRGARASAWLDGGDRTLPEDGNVTDPTLAAALRVADSLSPEAISEATRIWQRAPQQILAKFALNAAPIVSGTVDAADSATHSTAASDSTAATNSVALDAASRPVGDENLSAAMKEQRLHILGDFITGGTKVHAAVLSAIVHGELLTLQPFAHHNGIIARAASRLTTVASGLDPRGLGVPEVYWTRHREEYDAAAEEFKKGTPEGLRQWILLHLEGLKAGAVEARGIADAV